MNVQITSRKFKAKDSLKEFINKELKNLEKLSDDIIEANVILSFTHLKDSIKAAEINVKVPGKTLNATEESEDFNKSVSLSIDKIERQLRKLKTKKLAKHK